MRAVIRDIQEYVVANTAPMTGQIGSQRLLTYLYAMLITAGGFEDDGQG